MIGYSRSNTGSALTRKARKALKGRVESVTVKCSGYFNGSGEVTGEEIEPLMSARQILIDAGIYCGRIRTEWKALGPKFFISTIKEQVGD